MKRRRLCKIAMLSVAVIALAFPAHAATDQPEGWTMSASAGLGYDSNVYDSPKTPYFDQALLVPAVVTPNVQSGVFVPLEFDARYLADNMEFRYQFDGELYPSSKLSNANSYDHDVTLGWTRALDGWFQGAELYGGLLGGYHRQIYYDRDTGTPKLSINSGTDISNRYTHMDIGGEMRLHKKSDDMEYNLEGKVVNDDDLEPMRIWHQTYMPSNAVLARCMKRLSQLEIDRILPQHGSVLEQNQVKQAIQFLTELPCGLDLQEDR